MFKKRKKIKAPLRLRRFLRKCVKEKKQTSFVLAVSYSKIISAIIMIGVGILIIFVPIEAEGKLEIATKIIKILNFILLLFLSVTNAFDRISDSKKFYKQMLISSTKD